MVSEASSVDFSPGQEVLVYRENDKAVKWIGPFKILRLSDKQVFLD